MTIEGDDVTEAANKIAMALSGYSPHDFDGTHERFMNVTGGLFAIADAIAKLADAVEGLQRD